VGSKHYVFRSKGPTGVQMARFALVSFLFRASEYVAFVVLHEIFSIQYLLALVSVLTISLLFKFFVYKLFVFAHRRNPLPAAGL
jgi:putative flippase GtrA